MRNLNLPTFLRLSLLFSGFCVLYPVSALALKPVVPAHTSVTPGYPDTEDCSEAHVDRSLLGKPRDQGDMGLCYAYAAADMLTYCLNKKKSEVDASWVPTLDENGHAVLDEKGRPTGKVIDKDGNVLNDDSYSSLLVHRTDIDDISVNDEVSAFDIGLNYDYANFNMSKAKFEMDALIEGGGDPALAIKAVNRRGGVCMEGHFTSDAWTYDQALREHGLPALIDPEHFPDRLIEPTSTLAKKIMGYKVIYDNTDPHRLACEAEALKWPAQAPASTASCLDDEPRFHHLSMTAPQIYSNEAFEELLKSTQEAPPAANSGERDMSLMHVLDEKLCPSNKRVNLGSCGNVEEKNTNNDGTKATMRELDRLLSMPHPSPVGIGVWAHALIRGNDPNPYGANLKKDGAHAVLVTGRKLVNGVCKYQIRNSWGRNCHTSYANGSPAMVPEGLMYGGGPDVQCNDDDGGYFYVNRRLLWNALEAVSYL